MENKKSLCCGADVINLTDWYICKNCNCGCNLQKNSDLTLAEVYAVRGDVDYYQNERTGRRHAMSLVYNFSLEEACDRYTITDRKSWHGHIDIKKVLEKKEIKIGDTLTAEQAQKYIEAGGFVKTIENFYSWQQNILKWYSEDRGAWRNSHYTYLTDKVVECVKFTAVENPEKAESELENLKEKVAELEKYLDAKEALNKVYEEEIRDLNSGKKELNENCHGLKKEVEDLKSQLEAERKISEWLPFPENKPSFGGFILIKNNIDQVASVFYNVSYDQFQVSGSSHFQIDKSTIRFFREV